MSEEAQRWARRQYGWGIAFAGALFLLFLWLLIWPNAGWTAQPSGLGVAGTIVRTPASPQMDDPWVTSAALVQAEATLSAAAQNPVPSMGPVMDAAQTVVAATTTAELRLTPVGTPVPGEGGTGNQVPGAEPNRLSQWLQIVTANLPALTALVTFVGLVFTSLMKWRSDLHTTGRQRRELELRQHELELERHEYELARLRNAFELERQKLDFELARKKLELRALEDQVAALDRRLT